MSVADKLLQVNQVKQDIKTAIETKGVPMTNVAFTDYAVKIDEIPLPKEEQTKTVTEPNFSSGNVIVAPDAGKVLTQVTVVKDNGLVPENIVKDVNIFGVVGTAETGGGGGNFPTISYDEIEYFGWSYYMFSQSNVIEQIPQAWEHSLAVDPLEISEDSPLFGPGGKAQYPNGEIEGVIIPQGVTTIGNYAFMDWQSNNQPLVIPNSVTSIGSGAFWGWTSNNHPLIIPNSVTSIGDGAFQNWEANNQPLVIPESVTSIGSYAFRAWELVPYVEIQAITPPTLTNISAFAEQNNAPIYVPDDSVDDYKTATNWVNLAHRIFSINDK